MNHDRNREGNTIVRNFWQKLTGFAKLHKTILKAIFVMSVIVFVIIEVGRIGQDVDPVQLQEYLTNQSLGSVLSMLVLGLVAVTPMLNYDFVIQEFLPERAETKYILKSGWVVNTFNNLIGFGGVLGATMRATYYGKHASRRQVVFAVSKIALFLLSGLSVWSLLALVEMYVFGIGREFTQYTIWLIGGGLYFPILLGFTHLRESEFFADLPLAREMRLTLGSMLEWGFAGGFFLFIGYQLGLTHLAAVFPLFMIANVVGIASMVPGAIGSFDVFMIMGLSAVGVDPSIAVVWLLFYRVFYYLVPFAIAVVIFVQDMGKRINDYLQGIPMQLLSRGAHLVFTILLYFTAIMLLILATMPNFALQNHVLHSFRPYTLVFLGRAANIVIAFMLMGLARGIANKSRKAYWLTIIILILGMITTLLKDTSLKTIIFLGVMIIVTLLSRRELYRERIQFAWGDRLFDGMIYIAAFVAYAVAGFYNAPNIHHRRPVPTAWIFPSWRLYLSGLIAMFIAIVTVYLVLKYLSVGGDKLDAGFDADRVKAVINQYGGNLVSHLAFLRDKSIHYYQVDGQDQLFFMYRKKADKIIIMGEPVGNQDYLVPAVEEFMNEADKLDLSLVFYEVSEGFTMQMHDLGFDFMKFGEEGLVALPDFKISGNHFKGERSLMNRFKREGYTFDIIQPPFDDKTMARLQEISDSWLAGREEKGFSLGFMDRYYLEQTPVAVIRDKDGQMIAFANSMPAGSKETTSIDLMRHMADAPSGIMDEVFINLFYWGRDNGYQYFNMGMAPLSGVGTNSYGFLEERAAHLIYQYGYRFYDFGGLRSYKNKYVTKWVPRYVVYWRRSSVLFTMLQILLIVNKKIDPQLYQAGMYQPQFFGPHNV